VLSQGGADAGGVGERAAATPSGRAGMGAADGAKPARYMARRSRVECEHRNKMDV